MSSNMKIEKLCEYLVNFGLLKADDLMSFLKINSQISQNNYNDKEQLILTLFSYLASISKNEQQLYDISKNIIESFLSRQAIIGQLTKRVNTQKIENELDKNNPLVRSANNYKSMDKRNLNIFPIKKGNTNFNNMDDISFEEGKEFTFSPKNNRPKSNRIKNRSKNFPYRYDIDYDRNIFNKNLKIKNKNLYNDNKINNEIDKLYDYYSKQNFGKNYNSPNYNIFNIRDFYQKEENHVKKVEDKIMKLTMKQLKELEQACTFSPKIHEIPDYIIKNKIYNNYFGTGSAYDNNYYNMNNIRYINDLPYPNDQILNMKNNINKIIDEYAMDYYDIPLNNTKKYKKSSSSASKEISFGGNLSDKNNIPIKPNFSFSDKEREEKDMKLLNDLQKRFRIPVADTSKKKANGDPTQKRSSTSSKSKQKSSISKDKKSEENKSKISSNKPNVDKESKNSVSNQSQKKDIEKKEENSISNKEQKEKKDNIEDNNNNSSNKTDNNNEKNNTSSNKTDNNNEKNNISSNKTDNNNEKINTSSNKTDNNNEKNNISSNKTDNNNEKINTSSNKTDNEKNNKSSIKTDNNNEKNNSSIKTDNINEKNGNTSRSNKTNTKKSNNSSKSNKTDIKKSNNSSSINKTNTKKSNNNSSINKTNTKKSNNNSSINKTNTNKSNNSSSINKTDNEKKNSIKNSNNDSKNEKEKNNISSNRSESKNIGKDNTISNRSKSIKEEIVSIKQSKNKIEYKINESQNGNYESNNLPLLNEQIKIVVTTNKEELSSSDNNKNKGNEGKKQDKRNSKKDGKENNKELSEVQSSENNIKESFENNKDNKENNGEDKNFETIQDIITNK